MLFKGDLVSSTLLFSLARVGVFEPFMVILTLMGDNGACFKKGEHRIGETGLMAALRGDFMGELVLKELTF